MEVHLAAPPPPPRSASSVRGADPHQVLSLDQIRAIRATNDYVERPPLAPPPPPEPSISSAPGDGFFFYSHRDDRYAPQSSDAPQPGSQSLLSRSSTVSSSPSQLSGGSNLRLLVSSQSGPLRSSQPKGGGDPLKSSRSDTAKGASLRPPEGEESEESEQHLFVCERCGRCVCGECRAPRRLPSCWACGGRCLCSPQSAAEGATCLCCVKALLYHCCESTAVPGGWGGEGEGEEAWGGDGGGDPERDSCADRPCSCAAPSSPNGHCRCCARWGLMGALSLCLPCLCCYPPAALCVALCRRAHDLATRPGCRCDARAGHTVVVCRKLSSLPSSGLSAALPPDLHKHL